MSNALARAASMWRDRRAQKTVNSLGIYADTSPDVNAVFSDIDRTNFVGTPTGLGGKIGMQKKRNLMTSDKPNRFTRKLDKAQKRLGNTAPKFDPFA